MMKLIETMRERGMYFEDMIKNAKCQESDSHFIYFQPVYFF